MENTPRLQTTNEDACPIIPRGWVELNIAAQGAVRLHRTNRRGRVDESEKRKRWEKHKGRKVRMERAIIKEKKEGGTEVESGEYE